MTPLQQVAIWAAVVLAAISLTFSLTSQPSSTSYTPKAGVSSNVGRTETIPVDFANGLQIGPNSSGPVLKMVAVGTCNAVIAGLPLAATTTIKATCALGSNYTLQTSDIVDVTVGGNPTSFGSLSIFGAAVTTGGNAPTISFYYQNMTGAATSSFPLATTSVSFQAFRI